VSGARAYFDDVTRYVVLLRGVNVGGVNLKMADLAEVVRGLGYTEVKTVLASGNVVLESRDAASGIKEALQSALRERFGYEAWVQVLTTAALEKIIAGYPFERGRDGWHDYVMFTEKGETRDELLAVEVDPALEQSAGGAGVVYWTVERGNTLDSALGKASGAAKFKPWLTTRNMNTLDKLVK
jgi:uncharacterized protein (DUF1697 family)